MTPLLLLNRQGWKRLANDKNIERLNAGCYANEVEEAENEKEEEIEEEDQEEEKGMRRKRGER